MDILGGHVAWILEIGFLIIYLKLISDQEYYLAVKARLTGRYFQLNLVTLRHEIDENAARLLWKPIR
jgi:hypothetical protein